MSIEIQIYISSTGKAPYVSWEDNLDRQSRAVVAARIARLRIGNFGDCKALENAKGIYELRIHYGPGYRVYFAKKKQTIVILLCGGNKSTQKKDIQKAKLYPNNFKTWIWADVKALGIRLSQVAPYFLILSHLR